jgi:hypothetical protein
VKPAVLGKAVREGALTQSQSLVNRVWQALSST